MAPPRIDDLAGFLLGSWRIKREVLAAGRVPIGHFTGWGQFHADAELPDLLHYLERGTLHLKSHQATAFRRLGYHIDGPSARVFFDDGRPFHDLDLRRGMYAVEHLCRRDVYRARFEVISDRVWRHEWTVKGPRKHETIRTSLMRDVGVPAGDMQSP